MRRTRPGSSVEEGPPASRRRTAQTTASAPTATLAAQTSGGTADTYPDHTHDHDDHYEEQDGDFEEDEDDEDDHTEHEQSDVDEEEEDSDEEDRFFSEDDRFFSENEYVIMKASVTMMNSIVYGDGPYRNKLIQLARESIQEFNDDPGHDEDTQLSPEELVDKAWREKHLMWAPQSNENVQGGATAFASMGSSSDGYFPIIAFSDSFWENDHRVQSNVQRDDLLSTPMGKKTKLLFFKKLKHEFLNVIHRYLDILHNHHFSQDGTPVEYTPWKQANTARSVPEVGDHDEEEDLGGLLLPRYNNQELSDTNPLCLQYDGAFLELNDTQVNALLSVDIYLTPVREMRHDRGRWSCEYSRACQRGVFAGDFYDGDTGTTNTRARRSAGTGTASRRSSPTATRTPNLGRGLTPAWRLTGYTPIIVPESYFSRRRIVSRSSSPTEGLRY